MASLKGIAAKTADGKVEWEGEVIVFRWRLGEMNLAWYERLAILDQQARAKQDGETAAAALRAIRDQLARLVAWWDLTVDDGPEGPDNPMVEITSERMGELPEEMVLDLLDVMMEQAGKARKSRTTGAGGHQAAPSAPSPDGPHSFE